MRILLALLMGWMLLRPALTIDAAGAACRLFVQSVLPGLFPYMVFSLMLVSRMPSAMPGWLVMLMGWCGGSPTGARLMGQREIRDKRLAVACATMSPMFLLGTLGGWLNSPAAGVCILLAVVVGGYLTSLMVRPGSNVCAPAEPQPLSLGQAVEAAARTMLLVCGTMAVFRVLASLGAEALPGLMLPLASVLEVTTATRMIAALPLPLALRAALMAGVTGMGGGALMMQNRTCWPGGLMPLWQQALWQAVHGIISAGLCLGLMLLAGV